VSQAYLILYAYHLMSKVNIVNKEKVEEEETGVEIYKRKKKLNFVFFFIRVSCLLYM
jgi:hypothetical protein